MSTPVARRRLLRGRLRMSLGRTCTVAQQIVRVQVSPPLEL